MEITNQLNHNECGVCVINTLVKHYFKKDIKEELLKEANITDNGMSLYDFEALCDKHGILTETFKLEGEEFINFEYKSFFIALMNNELGLHYILVKKHKHRVEV
jgi:ABC-type bacteriocin/lantibiotic exporter with double-glycine peptidase domain